MKGFKKENNNNIEVHCAYDEMVDINKLKPHPKNYNTHPQKQIELLAKNIKELGWRHPITVSKLSGYVVSKRKPEKAMIDMAMDFENK